MPDPNPSTTPELATVPPVGRMTPAEYDAARALIEPSKAAAGVRWEQALARLFYRSGWTQAELAAHEKASGRSMGQQYAGRLLCFGRFLAFSENTPNGVNSESNLSEGRFRSYWERTAEAGHERHRFRAVLELMRAELTLSRPHTPKGFPKKIVEQFADHKWHALPVIVKHLEADEDEVEASLAGMVKHGWGGAKTETKRVGTVKHYRIFKNARMVSSTELIEKLAPIALELEAESRKNAATLSLMTVARLAAALQKLLREWAE